MRILLTLLLSAFPVVAEPLFDEGFMTASEYRQGKDWYWAITFNSQEKTYSENFFGEGCGGYSGTYSIAGNSVVLTPHDAICAPRSPMPVRTCKLEENKNDLDHNVFLRCGAQDLYARIESKVRAGERRSVDGQTLVMYGLRGGVITTGAKIRLAPGLNAPNYTCSYDNPFMGQDPDSVKPITIPFLREGTRVIVVGSLPNASKVQQWTNYWFYVRPVMKTMADFCSLGKDPKAEGWVFGEFVKLDDP